MMLRGVTLAGRRGFQRRFAQLSGRSLFRSAMMGSEQPQDPQVQESEGSQLRYDINSRKHAMVKRLRVLGNEQKRKKAKAALQYVIQLSRYRHNMSLCG